MAEGKEHAMAIGILTMSTDDMYVWLLLKLVQVRLLIMDLQPEQEQGRGYRDRAFSRR